MRRSTSDEVFEKIKTSGVLTEREWQTYQTLFYHGPMTAMMTAEKVRKTLNPKIPDHSITPRFSALEAKGAIKEIERKPCDKTGEKAIWWDVTDQMPIRKPPTKKTGRMTRKQLNERIGELEQKVYEVEEYWRKKYGDLQKENRTLREKIERGQLQCPF